MLKKKQADAAHISPAWCIQLSQKPGKNSQLTVPTSDKEDSNPPYAHKLKEGQYETTYSQHDRATTT